MLTRPNVRRELALLMLAAIVGCSMSFGTTYCFGMNPPSVTESSSVAAAAIGAPANPRNDDINVVEVKEFANGTVTLQAKVTITISSDDPDAVPESTTTNAILGKYEVKKLRLVSPQGKIVSEADLLKRLKPGLLIVREIREKGDQPPKNRALLKDDVIIWEIEAPKPEKK